ncbi:MAG TPA: nucleoside-diphosphate sugar epimerase/dehydratase [Steroidobacteraceae bacterium]|nr:nucleoside-diphosphate sugar epimerase/dehydratase [Steroidobacteraceae bacterium]
MKDDHEAGRYTSMRASATGALLALPRAKKRLVMLTADAIAMPLAFWAALVLKFDRFDPVLERTRAYFLVAVASALIIFSLLGLYRAVIRFMGARAMLSVVTGVTLSVLVVIGFDRALSNTEIPASAFAIYWALALLYALGSRFFVRYLFSRATNGAPATRVAISGAGDAGARLSLVLLGGPDFEPVAFIDDKKSLQGSSINGVTVFGPEVLPQLVRERQIQRVLLAMPSASRRRRREILSSLEPLGLHVQSLPHLSDLIAGKAHIDELRDVEVSDLLGRDAVPPNPRLFGTSVRGKCVLVTGAGGSIGSELCRQMLQLAPSRLVLFEMSEIALYTIERELHEIATRDRLSVEIVPLLGNAHHRHRVREVLTAYGVQTIYHAAAYKHVPIVEHNVVEGIHNNVVSTWYTAEAAIETGVETFVLVSTDKAVNPANVMGATKRLAELVLQALQERTSTTRFCMVRFGNVLASSGSVVPLFQEQIRRGGPVTVTHPDVIRYFMTIPEAAQLVIQAGSMAKGGDVFVLDMGRPVRIDDLARRMINLMGLTVRDANSPDGDIEIEYTGLRAAEKLFEELLIGTNVTGTDHPMILRAMEHRLPWQRMQQILSELLVALSSFDCHRALGLLAESVAEYSQGLEIRDYVWARKATSMPHAADAKIADFVAKRRSTEAGNKPGLGQSPV